MQIEVKYNLTLEADGYWRFQAWTSQCGDDDDPNIFVYQHLPEVSNKPDQLTDIFVDMASRHDMEEYPADAPAGDLSFYRKSSMDVSLQDSLEMQGAIGRITQEIQNLVNTYEVIT